MVSQMRCEKQLGISFSYVDDQQWLGTSWCCTAVVQNIAAPMIYQSFWDSSSFLKLAIINSLSIANLLCNAKLVLAVRGPGQYITDGVCSRSVQMRLFKNTLSWSVLVIFEPFLKYLKNIVIS